MCAWPKQLAVLEHALLFGDAALGFARAEVLEPAFLGARQLREGGIERDAARQVEAWVSELGMGVGSIQEQRVSPLVACTACKVRRAPRACAYGGGTPCAEQLAAADAAGAQAGKRTQHMLKRLPDAGVDRCVQGVYATHGAEALPRRAGIARATVGVALAETENAHHDAAVYARFRRKCCAGKTQWKMAHRVVSPMRHPGVVSSGTASTGWQEPERW